MNLLEDYHVNCSVICSENEATSYSVILAVPGIDRIFLHNPGANNTFMAKDISREVLEETALFHFGYPSLMRNMYRNDRGGTVKCDEMCKGSRLCNIP